MSPLFEFYNYMYTETDVGRQFSLTNCLRDYSVGEVIDMLKNAPYDNDYAADVLKNLNYFRDMIMNDIIFVVNLDWHIRYNKLIQQNMALNDAIQDINTAFIAAIQPLSQGEINGNHN